MRWPLAGLEWQRPPGGGHTLTSPPFPVTLHLAGSEVRGRSDIRLCLTHLEWGGARGSPVRGEVPDWQSGSCPVTSEAEPMSSKTRVMMRGFLGFNLSSVSYRWWSEIEPIDQRRRRKNRAWRETGSVVSQLVEGSMKFTSQVQSLTLIQHSPQGNVISL